MLQTSAQKPNPFKKEPPLTTAELLTLVPTQDGNHIEFSLEAAAELGCQPDTTLSSGQQVAGQCYNAETSRKHVFGEATAEDGITYVLRTNTEGEPYVTPKPKTGSDKT